MPAAYNLGFVVASEPVLVAPALMLSCGRLRPIANTRLRTVCSTTGLWHHDQRFELVSRTPQVAADCRADFMEADSTINWNP